MIRKIDLPMDQETRDRLRAGEEVYLNGTIYTARDAAHKRFHQLLQQGKPLPVSMQNAVIYYVGPTPPKPGQITGSAGPTTASRMDPYVRELAAQGMAGMIGKGRRNREVKEAIRRYHMIYFVAIGGAGALYSHCIIKKETIAFEDLLSEAVCRLEVKDFPCFVGIDTKGNDIYDQEDNL